MNETLSPLQKDGEVLDGYEELSNLPTECRGEPLRPIKKCARCGTWLRTPQGETLGEIRAQENREFCSPCTQYMILNSTICSMCGDSFFDETHTRIRCDVCEEKFQRRKSVCQVCGMEFIPYSCMACKSEKKHTGVCHHCHWIMEHEKEAETHERICKVCGCRFLPTTCIVGSCAQRLRDICPTCHEKERHDSMEAHIWTLPACTRCSKVVKALRGMGRKIIRHSVDKLRSGEEPDPVAMAALVIGGGIAPIVRIEGMFLDPDEVDALVEGEGA